MDIFSLSFIIFLISSFFLYYFVHFINTRFKKVVIPQWSVLLVASLVFYGFTNYFYLIYLGLSSLITYLCAFFCQYKDENTRFEYVSSHQDRRIYENTVTFIPIFINVSILATLKYFNFFASSVNSLFHFGLVTYDFIIPLGISFYTFSLISYSVDCCKRETKSELNPFKFLLFVSYFPKLLQGPISSYDKLKSDGLYKEHSFSDNNYLKSFKRISIGLVEKIVIANLLGIYVDNAYSNLYTMYGWQLCVISIFYTIQLFCDFAGFINICIGISGLFGINLEENFNAPYLSSSIQEFWQRWHITLGAWLRKYIYIPLGGNRVSVIRWLINILIVWLVSGLWHGANWTFVLWGLFHGVLIVLFGLRKQMHRVKGIPNEKHETKPIIKVFNICLTFILVNIGWILFRADNLEDAFRFMYHMVCFWNPSIYNVFSINLTLNLLLIICFSFVVMLILLKYGHLIKAHLKLKLLARKSVNVASNFIIVSVFFSVSIFMFFYLKSFNGAESSFIYFNF